MSAAGAAGEGVKDVEGVEDLDWEIVLEEFGAGSVDLCEGGAPGCNVLFKIPGEKAIIALEVTDVKDSRAYASRHPKPSDELTAHLAEILRMVKSSYPQIDGTMDPQRFMRLTDRTGKCVIVEITYEDPILRAILGAMPAPL